MLEQAPVNGRRRSTGLSWENSQARISTCSVVPEKYACTSAWPFPVILIHAAASAFTEVGLVRLKDHTNKQCQDCEAAGNHGNAGGRRDVQLQGKPSLSHPDGRCTFVDLHKRTAAWTQLPVTVTARPTPSVTERSTALCSRKCQTQSPSWSRVAAPGSRMHVQAVISALPSRPRLFKCSARSHAGRGGWSDVLWGPPHSLS